MSQDHSVDFLKEKYQMHPEKTRRVSGMFIAKTIGVFFVILSITAVILSYKIAETHMNTNDELGGFSLLSSFQRLVTSEDKTVAGEEDGRINILLLGVGGSGHDGPELTDSILVVSFQPSTNQVGILSIPRDLTVEIPGYGHRKINHANAYGEMQKKGSGIDLATEVIESVIDQEIHYAVKADFNGFEQFIDAIGGVDVYVERTFTDPMYPTHNYLYKTVTFKEGWEKMDGKTALMYTRSRHGNNGEGSDFARAKRQQNILTAVKDKVLTPATLLNPAKLNKMVDTVRTNVHTDMTVWEMIKLAKYAPNISKDQINHYVLDTSPGSPLYSSNINGAYVILPKKDDWSEVRSIAENIFDVSTQQQVSSSSSQQASEKSNQTRIEIQNGTSVPGLAFQTAQLLTSSGFMVQQVANADSQAYQKTIIYDLTEGKKAEELNILKDFFEADVTMTTSGWMYAREVVPRELTVTTAGEQFTTSPDQIDFLIVLGENAQHLVLR